jgi:hypothetical protein
MGFAWADVYQIAQIHGYEAYMMCILPELLVSLPGRVSATARHELRRALSQGATELDGLKNCVSVREKVRSSIQNQVLRY